MRHSNGFTLIEVIVIMIIMAIAAALFVSFMGTSYTQSPASAGLVNKQYQLIQQMEILTSNYRQALPTDGSTLDLCAFKATYVDNLQIDGKSIVDAANTSCTFPLSSISGAYTTTQIVLLVTLTDGQQTLQSIFTQ
ncbi:MAG: prepilin-type N-terminal cleavage/methylation domain-containing protein [Smithellaceae bacterium]